MAAEIAIRTESYTNHVNLPSLVNEEEAGFFYLTTLIITSSSLLVDHMFYH